MAEVSVSIIADPQKLQEFQTRIKTDPAVVQELATDAKGTLTKYGIHVDENTARQIQQHFGQTPRPMDMPGVIGPLAVVSSVSVVGP
jgi:hypothetical protein